MIILLPPSAGKTAPPAGNAPLDLNQLAFPEFTRLREELIDELAPVSATPEGMQILKAGPKIADEVLEQIELADLPTGPAYQVFNGVLYAAANFANLQPAQLERAGESVLIASALFGMLRFSDPIPRYRLGMSNPLPGGTPKARWAKLWSALDPVAENQLVIDARSADYAGWKPPASAEVVKINAVRLRGDGSQQTVSHSAKYFRGLIAGLALREPIPPEDPEALAELAGKLTGRHTPGGGSIVGVELDPPQRRGAPRELVMVEA